MVTKVKPQIDPETAAVNCPEHGPQSKRPCPSCVKKLQIGAYELARRELKKEGLSYPKPKAYAEHHGIVHPKTGEWLPLPPGPLPPLYKVSAPYIWLLKSESECFNQVETPSGYVDCKACGARVYRSDKAEHLLDHQDNLNKRRQDTQLESLEKARAVRSEKSASKNGNNTETVEEFSIEAQHQITLEAMNDWLLRPDTDEELSLYEHFLEELQKLWDEYASDENYVELINEGKMLDTWCDGVFHYFINHDDELEDGEECDCE